MRRGENVAPRSASKRRRFYLHENVSLGVESLGAQGYTVMRLMQIIGDRNVRIVPVSGANGNGLVDGLLGTMLRDQTNGRHESKES
jgi:hypothetical protein